MCACGGGLTTFGTADCVQADVSSVRGWQTGKRHCCTRLQLTNDSGGARDSRQYSWRMGIFTARFGILGQERCWLAILSFIHLLDMYNLQATAFTNSTNRVVSASAVARCMQLAFYVTVRGSQNAAFNRCFEALTRLCLMKLTLPCGAAPRDMCPRSSTTATMPFYVCLYLARLRKQITRQIINNRTARMDVRGCPAAVARASQRSQSQQLIECAKPQPRSVAQYIRLSKCNVPHAQGRMEWQRSWICKPHRTRMHTP